MKKLILLFAFITTGLFANAQNSAVARTDNSVARATDLTAKIAKVAAPLTPEQQTKVQAINLVRVNAMDKNRAANAANKEVFATEKAKILAQWNAELQATLNADQVAKLKAYQAEQKKLNKGEE